MKNRTVYLLIAIAVLALVAVFFWRRLTAQERFDWRDSWIKEAYAEESDQPYGTRIFHRLLAGYFPEKKLIDLKKDLVQEMPIREGQTSSYVFVGEAIFLDSVSTRHLLDFVKAGNTAFLSSKTIPFDLMFHVYYEECEMAEWNDYEIQEDSIVEASLVAPGPAEPVSLYYARQNQVAPYNWSYIESHFFCENLPQRPLGYLDESLINFAEFPHGKGRFLLHTTPIAFSNYLLLRDAPRKYAERILSYLPEGNIYWDSYSRVPEMIARRRNRNSGFSRQLPAEHPFSYILQQPPLAWAWYLLLGLAGVYLVFRAKRRQRIIPVLPKNENSSYEFISTIANLHFREKNYRNLCVQNMRLFLAQVRDRYGLIAQLHQDSLNPRMDEAYLERLSQVSEVSLKQIQNIFTQYAATVQYEPTEDMMVDLHLAMERFFEQAK